MRVKSDKIGAFDRPKAKAILLAITVALAIAGQVLLLNQKHIPGILCYLGALIAFCFATRRNPIAEPTLPEKQEHKFIRAPVLIISAFILSFLVGQMVFDERPIAFQRWAEPVGWLVSILLFSFAILYGSGWRFPRWKESLAGLRRNWKEIVVVAVIVLAALLVRTIDLTMHPYAVANDEGLAGLEALRLLNPGEGSMFTTASAAMPKLNFLPTALSILVFGRTFTAVRLPIALIGTLTVLFTYLAAKEMFGKRVGWIAAAILAFLPVHVHFSRTGFYTIIFSYFPVLLIWLTLRAVRLGRMSSFLLAGVAAAAAFYTHMGAWLAMTFPVIVFTFFSIFKRGWLRQNWLNLLVFIGVMLIVIGPQAAFFFKHPDMFLARYQGAGVIQTGDLAGKVTATNSSIWYVLGDQLAKSGLAFISIGATSGFYNAPIPYFMALTAIFLVLGMGFTCMHIRKPAPLLLLVWFWSVLVFGGMLTTNAPASNRLVMAFPAAAILVGLGLEQFSLALTRHVRIQTILIGVVVLVAAVDGVVYYFQDYREHNWYGDRSNELEFETIRMMGQLGSEYRLVLLGEPMVTVEFDNFKFFLPGYEMEDVPMDEPYRAEDLESPVLYVAIPERQAELEKIAQVNRGGEWFELDRRWSGSETLLVAYNDPPATLQLYSAYIHPSETIRKQWIVPDWAWWIVVIAAAFLLDLVVLPLIWRRANRQKAVPLRDPWKTLHKWGLIVKDWLEK